MTLGCRQGAFLERELSRPRQPSRTRRAQATLLAQIPGAGPGPPGRTSSQRCSQGGRIEAQLVQVPGLPPAPRAPARRPRAARLRLGARRLLGLQARLRPRRAPGLGSARGTAAGGGPPGADTVWVGAFQALAWPTASSVMTTGASGRAQPHLRQEHAVSRGRRAVARQREPARQQRRRRRAREQPRGRVPGLHAGVLGEQAPEVRDRGRRGRAHVPRVAGRRCVRHKEAVALGKALQDRADLRPSTP